MGLSSPIWRRRRRGGISLLSASAAGYLASNYNSNYDALVNVSNLTGDTAFGANLYADRARIYGGVAYRPASNNNYFSTPDSAANSITTNLEIIIAVAMDDWTPAATQALIGKWNSTAQRAYLLSVDTSGNLQFEISTDGNGGGSIRSAISTVAPTVADGEMLFLKATRNVTTGECLFYTSPDGITWTQLGASVSTSSGAAFDGTAVLEIGSNNSGVGNQLAGKVYYASVAASIDGAPAAEFDPSAVPNYAYGWRSSTGEDWTVSVSTGYEQDRQYKVEPAQLGSAGFYTNARIWGGTAYFVGNVNNYWSTPHTVSYEGDTTEIVVYATMPDWTPAVLQMFISKRIVSSNYQFQFYLATTGRLIFNYRDGSNRTATATVATGIPDGQGAWIKVRREKSGADQLLNFYISRESPLTPLEDINWVQNGATITGTGWNNPAANTGNVYIGWDTTTSINSGNLDRVAVYNDEISVIDFNAKLVADMATSFTDIHGNVFSVTKSTGSDTNDPTRLVYAGEQYVHIPSVGGNNVNTPDFNTDGDLDIIVDATMSSWAPGLGYIAAKNVASSCFRCDLNTFGGGGVQFFQTIATVSTSTTNVAHGITAGSRAAIRFQRVASTGQVTISKSDRYDGTWTQLTQQTLTSGNLDNTADAVFLFARNAAGAGQCPDGNLHYCSITANGVTRVFDATLTGQGGYTDAGSGTVWTVSRAASGKKTAVVDRTLLLGGTDDYLEVADHPLIDFTALQPFTVSIGFREFGELASQTRIAKKTGLGSSGIGYVIRAGAGTPTQTLLEIASASNLVQPTFQPSITVGAGMIQSAIYEPTSATLRSNALVNTLSWGGFDISNAEVLRVFRLSGSGTNYGSFEYTGHSTFRKALTAGELTTLKTELGAQ